MEVTAAAGKMNRCKKKLDGNLWCYLAINKVRHKTRCEVSNRNLGRSTVFFDILLKLLWVVF